MAGDEVERQYRTSLDRFPDGLLFYYFGNVDQVSHMMWRRDGSRASGLRAGSDAPYSRRRREALRAARRDRRPDARRGSSADDLLVVMSDHGFTSWRRAFHLNTWLSEKATSR